MVRPRRHVRLDRLGVGEQLVGVDAEPGELRRAAVVDPGREVVAGDLGMELHPEAAADPKRLHAQVVHGEHGGRDGWLDAVVVPLHPGPVGQ